MRILTEYEVKQICKCESCMYFPLRHLEECPDCQSKAWHITISEGDNKKKK